jgi:hypothetical protein
VPFHAGEVVVGTSGPLVVCGLGGVLVDLVRDVRFRLPPVSDVDAREMLSRLRAAPLLNGCRSMPPGDREALVALITRVSALVEVVPQLRKLGSQSRQGARAWPGRSRRRCPDAGVPMTSGCGVP